MKITQVTTTLLTGPCSNDRFLRAARRLRSAAFVEVHTDTGLVGLGETYAGYFCPEMVPSIVEFFAPILIGNDVSDIDELWRRMVHCGNFWCRVGLGASVLNGIEAALWDLKGKLLGLPVYELLGGLKHDRLPAYATGGPSNIGRLDAKRYATQIAQLEDLVDIRLAATAIEEMAAKGTKKGKSLGAIARRLGLEDKL